MSKKKRYHHVDLGFNYRMTNMQAAIGLAQMERLDVILEKRNMQMDFYFEQLKDIQGFEVRSFEGWCDPVHWLMTITLDGNYNRDDFLILVKVYFFVYSETVHEASYHILPALLQLDSLDWLVSFPSLSSQ